MNVSLTPELEQFVADTVATGRYSSASEVVRASLRKLEEQERWKAYAKAKIAEGLEDLEAGRVVTRKDFSLRSKRSVASARELLQAFTPRAPITFKSSTTLPVIACPPQRSGNEECFIHSTPSQSGLIPAGFASSMLLPSIDFGPPAIT